MRRLEVGGPRQADWKSAAPGGRLGVGGRGLAASVVVS